MTVGLRRQDVLPETLSVCDRLAGAGHRALVVGGCVRDLMLGRPAKDWDVATSAFPDEVRRLFRRTIPTGIQHGTITVMVGRTAVEVTTFRGEGAYSDARRPDTVTFGVTLEEDLARRDFTMNAIAFDPGAEQLADPFGGMGDLRARVIRAVGDPAARFREDGLRVMRAVRFAATLEFALDPATEAAIPGALDSLRRVSAERVRDELLKLLAARRPSVGLQAALRTGILGVVLPELLQGVGLVQNRYHSHDVFGHTLATVDATGGDPILRLAALLHDVGKPATAAPRPEAPGEHSFYRHEAAGARLAAEIARRLKLSNAERERIVRLVEHHMFQYTSEWTDASVRRFLQRVGTDLLPDLFALRVGDVTGRGMGEDPETELGELGRRIEAVLAKEQALSVGDLAIDGRDVMATLGWSPGPRVGVLLRALLERVVEDPALNERERLVALLPELAEKL